MIFQYESSYFPVVRLMCFFCLSQGDGNAPGISAACASAPPPPSATSAPPPSAESMREDSWQCLPWTTGPAAPTTTPRDP